MTTRRDPRVRRNKTIQATFTLDVVNVRKSLPQPACITTSRINVRVRNTNLYCKKNRYSLKHAVLPWLFIT